MLGIFFSKDRREEVIEIEEEPEIVFIPEINQRVKLMTQGQWMKGCPEPGEQNHLFSLYSQLSEGECPCPHGCGAFVKRKKSDFFAVVVRSCPFDTFLPILTDVRRPNSSNISSNCAGLCDKFVQPAVGNIASLAVSL